MFGLEDKLSAEIVLLKEEIEDLKKELIIVEVKGGCAYSDDPRVMIIDHDNNELETDLEDEEHLN